MCGSQEQQGQTTQRPVQISVTQHGEESAVNAAPISQTVQEQQSNTQQERSAVSTAHTVALNPEVVQQTPVARTLNMQRVQTWPPATKKNDGFWEFYDRYFFDKEFDNIGRIAEAYNVHLDCGETEEAGTLRTQLLSSCTSYLYNNSIQSSQRRARAAHVERLICDLLVNDDVRARAEENIQTALDSIQVNTIADHVQNLRTYPLSESEEFGTVWLKGFLKMSLDPAEEENEEKKTSQVQRTLITRIFSDNAFAAPTEEQVRKARAHYNPEAPEELEPVKNEVGKTTCKCGGLSTNLLYDQAGQIYGISTVGTPLSEAYRGSEVFTIGSFLHEMTHSADLLTYRNSTLTLGFPPSMENNEIIALSKHRLAIVNRAKSLVDSAKSLDEGLKSALKNRLEYMGLKDKTKEIYFNRLIPRADTNSTAESNSEEQKNAWALEKTRLEQYKALQKEKKVNFTVLNEYDACMAQSLHFFESYVSAEELEGSSETAQLYRLFKAAALETFVLRDQYIQSNTAATVPS